MSHLAARIARRTIDLDTAPRRPLPIATTIICMLGALNIACVVGTLLHG